MKNFLMFCRVLPLIGFVVSSCSSPFSKSSRGDSQPSSAKVTSLSSASTPKVLSMGTACALAVSHHPSMASFPLDMRAADARVLRASRAPNPSLSFDVEDFFGTGGFGGFSASLLNTLLTQVIERGGKREARTEAARSESAVMVSEYKMTRLQVIQKTGELYIDAVASHENVLFLEHSLKRSQETLDLITMLSEAGRVTMTAVQQAQLEVETMELEIGIAQKSRERASQALTAQWGDSRSSLIIANGLASPPPVLGAKSSLSGGLTQHPRILKAQAEVAQAEAYLKLAEAGRFENVSIFGGARRTNGSDDFSGLLGVGIPLQIFDKKKDPIAEMTALSEKAKMQLSGTRRDLETQFSLAWADLVSTHQAARKVKEALLPTASALFRNAEESFRFGKVTSLEYLAAQQQFQDIRGKWLTARRDYQVSAARVQTLTNRSL